MNKIKTPLTGIGGKNRQGPIIKDFLPPNSEVDHFFDPFCGGGSVWINYAQLNPDSKIYVIDKNHDIGDFFNSITDPKILENFVEILNNSQKLLETPKISAKEIKAEAIKTAASLYPRCPSLFPCQELFINNAFNFGGYNSGTATIARIKQSTTINKVDNLINFSNGLSILKKNQKLKLNFGDYSVFLKAEIKYLSPESKKRTFVFLDPPYEGKDKLYKTPKMNYPKLKDQCIDLTKMGVKFLLTINDSPPTRALFSEFNIYPQGGKYTSKNKLIDVGKELFITNYRNKLRDEDK